MKKHLFISFGALFFASFAFAQCAPSTAMDTLNINQVSALMLNGGDLWWNPAYTVHGQYEVPKGSGRMPIYSGAFWIGGMSSGNLYGAAQTYRSNGNDFWPGPLDTINAHIDSSDCSLYDKIWKVNRDKVEDFKYYWAHGNVQNGTYYPDPSILSWPGNGNTSHGFSKKLAPYVDVNHNGVYDPLEGGDYPKMMGDQMLWWVMNDKGNIHKQTQCSPMGIEIHVSAYAYTCPQIADSLQVINYTTLYHYEIINRSSIAYDSVYVTNWQDGDLGCVTDDRVGCYPKGNYSYYYNGDSIDVSCSGELGYGNYPPISSTVILNGPLAKPNDGVDNNNNGIIDESGEKNLMTGFIYFLNGNGPPTDPSICKEYYNCLSGSWYGGLPITYGGMGYFGTTHTRFVFPDFPYDTAGWSELAVVGFPPGDRQSLTSCGPFSMLPGAVDTFDFAVVYTRDTTLPFMSKAIFDKNLHDNQCIQRWFAKDSFPSCLQLNLGVNDANQMQNAFSISPNPTSGICHLTPTLSKGEGVVEIYSVLGERVLSLSLGKGWDGLLDLSFAKNGIYFLQIKTSEGVAVKKVVVSR